MISSLDNDIIVIRTVEKRIQQHNESKEGAKYTRSRRPCKLVYHEEFDDKSEALKREYFIKHKMMKSEKLALIDSYGK